MGDSRREREHVLIKTMKKATENGGRRETRVHKTSGGRKVAKSGEEEFGEKLKKSGQRLLRRRWRVQAMARLVQRRKDMDSDGTPISTDYQGTSRER